MMPLISFTPSGLYCAQAGIYIDPWKPVQQAIISHAHSDHAISGHTNYLCHRETTPVLQLRLGENNYQSVEWGETITINDVRISLHPAGHIIGSSQVRLEYKGEVWVFSGDYKLENDGISGAFEPVKCHTFITESTFGLPIYKWKSQEAIYNEIQNWVLHNQGIGKASVLIAYSLGKAQRVLQALSGVTNKVLAHGAIYNVQQMLQQQGRNFIEVERVTPEMNKASFKNAVILAPPSADGTPWMKKFQPYSLGICSGWMQVRGNLRRRNADKGFALSDHCDWDSLLTAVKATGAERVFVTHGFQSAFSRYLNEQGIEAHEVSTQYGNDEDAATKTDEEENT